MEFESMSTTTYCASSQRSLIRLLSTNSSMISSMFSSVFLIEHIIGNGNSNIISFTFCESQLSISGDENWKGDIRLIRNSAERVATASTLLRKISVFWQKMAVSINSSSSQAKLEKNTGQQKRDTEYWDLKPNSGRVPKQQPEWQQTWLQSGRLLRKQARVSLTSSFFSTSQMVLAMLQARMFSFSMRILRIMILEVMEWMRCTSSVWMLKKGQQVTDAQIFSPTQISFSLRRQFFSSLTYTKSGSLRQTTNKKKLGLEVYRQDFFTAPFSKLSSPFRVNTKQSQLSSRLGLYSIMLTSSSLLSNSFLLSLHPSGNALLAISVRNCILFSRQNLVWQQSGTDFTVISSLLFSVDRFFLKSAISGPITTKVYNRFSPQTCSFLQKFSSVMFRMLLILFSALQLAVNRIGGGKQSSSSLELYSYFLAMLGFESASLVSEGTNLISNFSSGLFALRRSNFLLGLFSRLLGIVIFKPIFKFTLLQLFAKAELCWCLAPLRIYTLVSSYSMSASSLFLSASRISFSLRMLSKASQYS